MKSRTAFFNFALLKKDITRFAPVWGLYLLLLMLQVNSAHGDFSKMVWPLLAYAIICAIALFGDLFSPRRCNALHAMPISREGWFLTHLIAGFLFFFIPTGIFFLVQFFRTANDSLLILAGFGASFVVFFTFFSIALLCVMLAGNGIGAVTLYAVLNFLAPVASWIFKSFYLPLLHGVTFNGANQLFSNFFLAQQFRSCAPGIRYNYLDYPYSGPVNLSMVPHYTDYGNWTYLLICTGVALLFIGLALLLYRKRNLERAGDLVAFRWLAGFFPPAMGLMLGVAVFQWVGHPVDAYLFLLLYVVIGFLIGRMLLEKKFNVFHPKKFLSLGILILALFVTVGITRLDPLGFTRYVPKLRQVERVEACNYTWDSEGRTLNWSAPEDIQAILDTHASLITERNEDQTDLQFRLRYHLKDGSTVERLYYMDSDSPGAAILENHMSQFQFVTQKETVENVLKDCSYLEFHPVSSQDEIPGFTIDAPDTPIDKDGFRRITRSNELVLRPYRKLEQSTIVLDLMNAVYADCEAGTMAQKWPFPRGKEKLGQLTIYVHPLDGKDRTVTFHIFKENSNTYAYLKSLLAETTDQP